MDGDKQRTKRKRAYERHRSAYEALWRDGTYYEALWQLGDALTIRPSLAKQDRGTVTPLPGRLEISEAGLSPVRAQFHKDAEYIERILDHGATWDPDEVLLVVTLRDGMFKVSTACRVMFGVTLPGLLDDLDEIIVKRLAKQPMSGATRRLFGAITHRPDQSAAD